MRVADSCLQNPNVREVPALPTLVDVGIGKGRNFHIVKPGDRLHGLVATVFGASGFVGAYVVKLLGATQLSACSITHWFSLVSSPRL